MNAKLRHTIWAAVAVFVAGTMLIGTLFSGNQLKRDASQQTVCKPKLAVSNFLVASKFNSKSFEFTNGQTTYKKTDAVNQNGAGAFASSPVLTTEQLNSLLKSTTGKTAAASNLVTERLKNRKVTWVGVKFLTKIDIQGNLGIQSGKVVSLGTRHSSTGDVIWFAVDNASCSVVKDVIIRAGCGNPGKSVTPVYVPPRHRHKPKPRPTPIISCPPGFNLNVTYNCVKPKSTNPHDYTYPTGKLPVPKVTTTPEVSPPPVKTSQTDGNGVVDSPTKAPGSPTGVTAPGAIPAPTTAPTPLPPNEGGSNSGSVSGF